MFYFSIALASIVYASLCEWMLHRYVMHRPLPGFRYPFERHTLVHHHKFKADDTYHLIHKTDANTIPMAWWNGPVLIVLSSLPALSISALSERWSVVFICALVVGTYYGAYEYLHWCMHLPKARRVECFFLFRRLNGHHLLHHRYMGHNFNVVFPIWDLLFGTLLRRSPVRFAQAQSPALPDVQPLTTH